jgi:phosphatidate cytidylyltransferase
MSDAETPIPQSDLPTRFAVGVVLIAVALVAVWLGGWPFRILAAAAAAIMLVEWADMHKVPRLWAWAGAALIVLNLLAIAEYFYPAAAEEGATVENFALALRFAPVLGFALLLGLASRRPVMAWGYAYIGIPAFALMVMSWIDPLLVLWVLVVTWATDIFAYFAGRAIGGPKLAPAISPNKTWAGLGGGMAGAAILGWLVARGLAINEIVPWIHWYGAAMGLIAQAGDLYESWVKRRAGVKDSGSLLPGHGGALDRLDGLLAVSAATMVLLMADYWSG